jgi:hypothetical protein
MKSIPNIYPFCAFFANTELMMACVVCINLMASSGLSEAVSSVMRPQTTLRANKSGTAVNSENGNHSTLHLLNLSTMDDDDLRWPNNTNQLPRRFPTIWVFRGEEDFRTGCLQFSAVDDAGRTLCDLRVHRNLALALAYLDIDYWATNQLPTSLWNRMRIQGYLLTLREDVVTEMMAADPLKLLHCSFGTSVLRQWAIRVYHGFGHSFTGRNAYVEFCTSNRCNLYRDDFINYGESNSVGNEEHKS